MSRRTYPRFAAGLFAAALAAPLLLAQPPNPWRGQSANPWRNAAADAAPMPQQYRGAGIEFRLNVTSESAGTPPVCCNGGCSSAAAAAPMPREKHTAANQEFRVEFVDSGTATPRVVVSDFAYPLHDVRHAPAAAPQLAGTWYREMPGMMTAFAVTGNELKITLTTNTGEGVGTATVTADCAVTKDGTVHGVFTGADVDVTDIKNALLGMDLAQLQLELQELVDQPFAFRCRSADGGLMVSNVRLPGSDQPREVAVMLCGKYKAANGTVPTPKPAPIINQYSSDPNLRMQQLLPADLLPPQRVGRCESGVCPADTIPPAPVGPYPTAPVLVAPPPAPMPTTRGGPPPEVRDTMIRVFTEMMNGPGAGLPACPGPVCVPPATAVMPPYLSADIAQATYPFPVPPPPPMPVPVAAPVRAGQLPVGTWYREVGPIRYKIDAKDGHLTVTVTLTEEEDGKAVTLDHVLTADCYPTRTEGEVVGLITGFDMAADEKVLDLTEAGDLLKDLPKLQQALEGKPIALTFRVNGDNLVIGKVRMPPVKNEDGEASAMFAAMGGRYTSSPKPTSAAKTKTGKRAVRFDTPPGEEYRQHPPQYVPAVSEPARIGIDFNFNPPLAIGAAAGLSVPPMVPPPPLPAPVPAIPRSR